MSAGTYLTGPYQALQPNGRQAGDQISIIYDANTGGLKVDTAAGTELTSINIESASGIFTGEPAKNLGGNFDIDYDGSISKATFGGSFGSISFGSVSNAGLSKEFLLADLTVDGSLVNGGTLGDVDLIYVSEPSIFLLLAIGMLGTVCIRQNMGLDGDGRYLWFDSRKGGIGDSTDELRTPISRSSTTVSV